MITMENGHLSLTVDPQGAQMMHLSADGTEHLWQGDPAYWPDRAPTLFPFIGRLWSNRYRYFGNTYAMGIHGFAAASPFCVVEQGRDHVVLELTDNERIRESYPFAFSLEITYRLRGDQVEITYRVHNRDDKIMPFGIGGHPGFRVPWQAGESFEDYYLEFSTPCQPDRVGFTPEVYLSGCDEAYLLEDGTQLPLHHDLFDEDAVILKNMCREVTLRSGKNRRYVKVTCPRMPYLGIWHWPKTDAPYVCIEPWSSLPGRQAVVEEFSCKSDLIHLQPGETYQNTWWITIGEDSDD